MHEKEPSLLTQYSFSLHGDCSTAHSSKSVDNNKLCHTQTMQLLHYKGSPENVNVCY